MISLPFQDINVAGFSSFQSICQPLQSCDVRKSIPIPSKWPEKSKDGPHFNPQELELAEVLKAKVLGFFRWKNWNHLSWKQDVVSQALWQAT